MSEKSRFESWIFESYNPTAEGLALYRIFASLFFLFFLLPDFSFYSVLSEFPDDFYAPPPGPMALSDSFPPAWFLQGIHLLLILSWITVLVGYKTKWASITAGVSMLILHGFLFSLGKINHEMLLSITPIVMAFSNWGAAYSVDSQTKSGKSEPQGWPLVLLALFIGFMMATAGFPKILGGWLDPSTQATKGHLLNQFFVRGRTELLAPYAVQWDWLLFWELLDWGTILFEVGFLVAVFRPAWTRLFVCIAVFFHFSTMLTLNIAFLVNFLAYAAFIKWDSVEEWLRKKMGETGRSRKILVTVLLLSLFFGVLKWMSVRGVIFTPDEPALHDVTLIGIAVLIVIFTACRKAILQFRKSRL